MYHALCLNNLFIWSVQPRTASKSVGLPARPATAENTLKGKFQAKVSAIISRLIFHFSFMNNISLSMYVGVGVSMPFCRSKAINNFLQFLPKFRSWSVVAKPVFFLNYCLTANYIHSLLRIIPPPINWIHQEGLRIVTMCSNQWLVHQSMITGRYDFIMLVIHSAICRQPIKWIARS